MRRVLQFISFLGLALVIIPSMLYLFQSMDKTSMKGFMLAGTLLWFATVPFWLDRSVNNNEEEEDA